MVLPKLKLKILWPSFAGIRPETKLTRYFELDGVPVRVDFDEKDEPFAAFRPQLNEKRKPVLTMDPGIIMDTLNKGREVTEQEYLRALKTFLKNFTPADPKTPGSAMTPEST